MSIDGKYKDTMADASCVYNIKDGENDLWFGINISGNKSQKLRADAASDISHAINMHDELVEALGIAVHQINHMDSYYGCDEGVIKNLEFLLAKAKGEQK